MAHKCFDHGNEDVKYWCDEPQCKKEICERCMVLGGHLTHRKLPLANRAASHTDIPTEETQIPPSSACETTPINTPSNLKENIEQRVHSIFNKAKSDIDARLQQVFQMIASAFASDAAALTSHIDAITKQEEAICSATNRVQDELAMQAQAGPANDDLTALERISAMRQLRAEAQAYLEPPPPPPLPLATYAVTPAAINLLRSSLTIIHTLSNLVSQLEAANSQTNEDTNVDAASTDTPFPSRVLFIGGLNPERMHPISEIDRFDTTTTQWDTPGDFSLPSSYTAAATVNDMVYVCGGMRSVGIRGDLCIANVFCFHTSTNIDDITMVTDMPIPRARHAAVVLDSLIFLVGGVSSHVDPALATVHVYSPATNEWTTCAPLLRGCSFATATVLNNYIYAIGGIDGVVQIYDSGANKWFEGPRPNQAFALLAALGGRVYSVDGSGTAIVKAFDPREGEWHEMASLTATRKHPSVAASANGLFVFGGDSGDGETATSVEQYDPRMNCWSLVDTKMPRKREHCAVVVV